jgi:hypothetical protein
VRTGAGPNAAAITPVRDTFRNDLGGGTTAGANGSFGGVRREINWDGVPANLAAPNNLPGDFFNTTSPRGAVFTTQGTGFQVSADVPPAASGQERFGNLNQTYPTAFAAFSAQKLFTALGSTVTDVRFFVPGTTTPAMVKGFGVVFADVDISGSTKVEYFDAAGNLLNTTFALASAGNGGFSFVGVTFDTASVARVRITSGNGVAGANDVTQGGPADVVMMDDFIYGEPQTTQQAGNPGGLATPGTDVTSKLQVTDGKVRRTTKKGRRFRTNVTVSNPTGQSTGPLQVVIGLDNQRTHLHNSSGSLPDGRPFMTVSDLAPGASTTLKLLLANTRHGRRRTPHYSVAVLQA